MTLAELLTTRTEGDIQQSLASDLVTEGLSTVGWSRESVQYALLTLFARAQAAEQGKRADVARASSRLLVMQIQDTATRDAWLDVIAQGFYSLERFPAQAARHAFAVTATALASAQDFTPRSRIVQDETGLLFINTGRRTSDLVADPATVRISPGTTVILEFECLTPGSIGNIATSANLRFVNAIAGYSVSNANVSGSSVVVRGSDAESSESLNARCDARWGATAVAQLPGSLTTWIHEAFTSRDVTSPVEKWRIDDENPNGPGSTDVYISAGGVPTAEILATVDAYLRARRGVGSGPMRTLPVTGRVIAFTVWIYTLGNSTTNISDVAAALALVEFIEPIGGVLYKTDIIAAARSVRDVYNVVTDFPDVIQLGTNEIAGFTPTIVQV